MALTETGETGASYPVDHLSHREDFDQVWLRIPAAHWAAIEAEINRRLDDLIRDPSPNWGSITNTSIEGGKPNQYTGTRATGLTFATEQGHRAGLQSSA